MAKKQTFGDKTNKSKQTDTRVKLIRTNITDKKSISFSEEMVVIPDGKQPESVLKEVINAK